MSRRRPNKFSRQQRAQKLINLSLNAAPKTKGIGRGISNAASKTHHYGGAYRHQIAADLELPGLASEQLFNPSILAWKTELDQFFRETANIKDPLIKLERARKLSFYKYFDETGLAQMVLQGGPFAKQNILSRVLMNRRGGPHITGPMGADVGIHSYVSWANRLGATEYELLHPVGRKIRLSQFGFEQGIIQRSLSTLGTIEEMTEEEAVTEFVRGISQIPKSTLPHQIIAHNAIFEGMGLTALSLIHGEHLLKQGLDPFMIAHKFWTEEFVLSPVEDMFFQVLAAKGLRDKEWAKQYLRFGKMSQALFPEVEGVFPGAPITGEMLKGDASRIARGEHSFLRSRAGWNLEVLDQVFLRYMNLSQENLGIPFEIFRKTRAHDALRDTAVAAFLRKRFKLARSLQGVFENMHTPHVDMSDVPFGDPSMSHNNRWHPKNAEVLSMARAGFLGPEFQGGHIKKLPEFAQWLWEDRSRWETAQARLENQWNTWTDLTRRSLVESVEAGRRVVGRKPPPIHPVYSALQQAQRHLDKFNRFRQTIRGKWWLAGGAVGALAAGWMVFGHRDRRVSSNIPPNYLKGMQANSQGVAVPWHSPWAGPIIDTETSDSVIEQASVSAKWGLRHPLYIAAIWASYNIWGFVAKLPPSVKGNLWAYKALRIAEDILPFRIGRVLDYSSRITPYLAPENLSVSLEHLLVGGDLTQIGEIYARGLNLNNQDFTEYLAALHRAGRKNISFRRSGSRGTHEILFGDDVAKTTKLFGQRRAARFFAAGRRHGKSAAIYGMTEAELSRRVRPSQIYANVLDLFNPKMGEGPLRIGLRKFGAWLYKRSPLARKAIESHFAIPTYDLDPVNRIYRKYPGLKQLYVPAHESLRSAWGRLMEGQVDALGAVKRWAGLTVFNWYRSPWGLLRQRAANIGINIGPAPTLRVMARKTVKAGLAVGATFWGLKTLNDMLGGALSAPFFNAADRISIAYSGISDKLGLTKLRKKHPDVARGAALSWYAFPFVGIGVANYVQRALGVPSGIRAEIEEFEKTGRLDWAKGARKAMSEKAFTRRKNIMSFKRSTMGLRVLKALTEPGDFKIGKFTIFKGRRPTAAGWLAGGLWAGVSALFTPFLFGTATTKEERQDILAGRKKVEIRKGRWWEFGSTPYEGGRGYFRLHQSARRRMKLDQAYPEEKRGFWSRVRDLFDPYWRERAAYYRRPYPITGVPFQDTPLIGGILGRTIGRFLKPQLLMHTDEWKRGEGYTPYNLDIEPKISLGGLAPAKPMNPFGIHGLMRDIGYRATEFMGLRGFLIQSTWFKSLWGGQAPYGNFPFLAQSRFGGNLVKKYYQGEWGGMLGMNELLRRFFPRPEPGTEVNPLRNQMPSWMPGQDYIINFHQGDPYSKVSYGLDRLPGPGFEKLHPSLEGKNPEEYPAWARMEILADVAPWSKEYKHAKSIAFKQATGNPEATAYLERIEAQREEMVVRKRFQELSFRERTETITGHVGEFLSKSQFRLAEYPHHVFNLRGASFSLDKVSDHLRNINGWTKEKAVMVAAKQEDDRQAFLQELMGGEISLRIHRGGLNAPAVDAEVFTSHGGSVARRMVDEGYGAPEPGREQAGFIGRLFGRGVEFFGHLPQHVPGPFFLNTKLNNMATPEEAYRREQLYGSDFSSWDKPWSNFMRPYLYRTLNKFTPGDFIPPHVRKRRDIDTLFDRLTYLKSVETGNMRGAVLTMAGTDVTGSPSSVKAALPYRERPYFEHFVGETDPKARKRILGMVSEDMQRALVGQWWRQHYQAEGQTVPSERGSITENMNAARQTIMDLGYNVPRRSWIGWNPDVDMQDVQAIHIQTQGLDNHDFNIWEDRINTLSRKPYLKGSHRELVSQPMDITPSILSREVNNTNGFVGEHISHRREADIQYYHNVDQRDREDRQFSIAMDKLRNR
jgi:hypothetical protein